MMPPQRVKESCIPCRQRKSRCNAEIPCSSCTLRGTESDCQLPSQSSRPSPSIRRPVKATTYAYGEASTSRRSSPEYRRSASPPKQPPPPSHSQYPLQSGPTPSSSEDAKRHSAKYRNSLDLAQPPPTLEERRNWERVLAAIPPRAACEILLEYLIQECDWLCHFGDVVGAFQRAIARGGVPSGTAGLLCLYLAIPLLLLGDAQSPLYRPSIPNKQTASHQALFELGRSFSLPNLASHDDLELILALEFYMIYSGLPAWAAGIQNPVVRLAEREGYFDESLEGWDGLSHEERNNRRRVGWGIVSTCRWKLLFMTDDPLLGVRVNLCRPHMVQPQLSSPIHLPFPPRAGDEGDAGFRVLRIKSQAEHARVARYRDIIIDLAEMIPRIRSYLLQIGKVDTEISLSECEALYRELSFWLDERIPSAGFERIAVEKIDFSDIVSCRQTAQSLVLHLAIGHISANLLRHWLSVGDITSTSPSPHKRLYAACLDNAKRSMDQIPSVKALGASKYGPLIAPFVAGNLFNAATSFAVPVLRAVKYWTSCNTEEDIRQLPLWPEHAYPTVSESRLDGTERLTGSSSGNVAQGLATMRLPSNIYTDSSVKECATNILVILDALSELNANPLGQEAEKRLAALIHQYGLRDSQNVQPFDHWSLIGSTNPSHLDTLPPTPSVHSNNVHGNMHSHSYSNLYPNSAGGNAILGATSFSVSSGPMSAPQNRGGSGAAPPGSGGEIQSDFAFLGTLLQMDGSIWEGLLEAGAITRTDGRPLVSDN